jgi:integrase/recombinase XerD
MVKSRTDNEWLPKQQPGDLSDPAGFACYRERFIEWLGVMNYSVRTAEHRARHINYFMVWAAERGLTKPREITKQILERYQRYLYHYRKDNGEPLSTGSQRSRVASLRAFFSHLSKNNHILYNPAADLDLPRQEKRLPKHVLTIDEVETILNVADVTKPLGVRDRAILEVFYSTGIRRSELINLRLFDLDSERGTLMVRLGKGNKDRMVPIGERAIAWIDKYRYDVRPEYVPSPDPETLFLTHKGEAFSPARMTQMVRRYVNKADIGKSGSCHLFRHAMATQMLENGADIRYLQEMLGHAKVDTTQIYTQVSIRRLIEVHKQTHPAKLVRDEQDKQTLLNELADEGDEGDDS